MRPITATVLLVSLTGILGLGPTATAGVLDSLHAKVRVGGKLCFADHSHTGSSFGAPTKGHALQAAITDWTGFTALEYGQEWGQFSLAWAKSIRCEPSSFGKWGCQIEARPCRIG